MKASLILLFLAFHSAMAQLNEKQFPEDAKTYESYEDTGFSQYIAKSLHGTNKIALTYDDGPHPTRTPALLDTLKKYNVKATFFILTGNITWANMPILERMINEGHTLASHDWDHTNSNSQSKELFKRNLKKSINAVEWVYEYYGLHSREMYYRFPYGDYGRNKSYHHLNVMKEVSQEIYNDNCINFAFWDIDTADWVQDMDPISIKDNILAQIFGGTAYTHHPVRDANGNLIRYTKKAYQVNSPAGGGVVLLHDIHQRTIEATELFLQEFQKRGVEVVPLSEVEEFDYKQKECVVQD